MMSAQEVDEFVVFGLEHVCAAERGTVAVNGK